MPIKNTAIELNVCEFKNDRSFRWNGIEGEIDNLKKNFTDEDIPVITLYKDRYIEYRTKTNCNYFQDNFFRDLDRTLKELFDFFKTTDKNEFEPFEIKTVYVNSIHESATKKLMSIPTKAKPEEILEFWFKLAGNNEKGESYWKDKKEIEHFVNQNFDGFPGVNEIKVFNPNLNKSELRQITATFFEKYGISKSKLQYANLLKNNFIKFRDDGIKDIYSNIKDHSNRYLKELFK